MSGLALLPIFLTGLLGSIHCIGMCGGTVGAFSITSMSSETSRRPFPVPVKVAAISALATMQKLTSSSVMHILSYHLGHIGTYM